MGDWQGRNSERARGRNLSMESILIDEVIGEIRTLGERIGQPLPVLEAKSDHTLTGAEQIATIALDRAVLTLQLDTASDETDPVEERVLRIASRYRRWLLAHAAADETLPGAPEIGE